MYIYKMNVKLDMNTLNCVLLVVVLSLVIMCCLKTNNESFQSIGAPLCNSHGSKKPCNDQSWCTWGLGNDGTNFIGNLYKPEVCYNKIDFKKIKQSSDEKSKDDPAWDRNYVRYGSGRAQLDLECEKYEELPADRWNIKKQCNLDPDCSFSDKNGCKLTKERRQQVLRRGIHKKNTKHIFTSCAEIGMNQGECRNGQGNINLNPKNLDCLWSSRQKICYPNKNKTGTTEGQNINTQGSFSFPQMSCDEINAISPDESRDTSDPAYWAPIRKPCNIAEDCRWSSNNNRCGYY